MKWGLNVFGLFGSLAIAGGLMFFAWNLWFCFSSESVVGKISEVDSEARDKADIDRQRRENVTHAHIDYNSTVITVEYLVDGKVLEAEFDIGEQPAEVGDTIDLLYQQEDPTNPKLSGFRWLFLGPLTLTFMGAVFYLVAQLGKLVT